MKDREEIIEEVVKLIDAEAEKTMQPRPQSFDQTPPNRLGAVRNFRNRPEVFKKVVEIIGKELSINPQEAFQKELKAQEDFLKPSPFNEDRKRWPESINHLQSSRDIAKYFVKKGLVFKSLQKKKGVRHGKT